MDGVVVRVRLRSRDYPASNAMTIALAFIRLLPLPLAAETHFAKTGHPVAL
jgi:hypothetical protein